METVQGKQTLAQNIACRFPMKAPQHVRRAKRDFCIPLQSHLNKKQFTLQIWLKHVRRVDGAGVHLVGQVVDESPLTGLPFHLSFQMLPFLPIYRSRALNPLKKPASRKTRKLSGLTSLRLKFLRLSLFLHWVRAPLPNARESFLTTKRSRGKTENIITSNNAGSEAIKRVEQSQQC